MAKTFTRVRNALLMPLTGTLDNFSAGVFADGVCLPASLQERASAAKALPPLRHLPGDYIFGGYFFHHYGHFMLESLSRLYAIKQCKKLPLLFMCLQKTIPQQHAEIFQLVGLDSADITFVHEPVSVDSIIVSPTGVGISPPFMLPEQMAALGQVKEAKIIPGKKIWLSRSNYLLTRGGSGVLNEMKLDKALMEMGWEIVAPELLTSVKQQLLTITSAEYVAGFDGSAFYTTLLAQVLKGHYIIFGRRNSICPTIVHMLEQKGADLTKYVLDVTNVYQENGKKMLFVLPDLTAVTDKLAHI